jgi:hypothetical protein
MANNGTTLFSLRIQQAKKRRDSEDSATATVHIGYGTGASKTPTPAGNGALSRTFRAYLKLLNQRRLFSANVSTSTAMEMKHQSRIPNRKRLSNQTSSVNLMDSFIENDRFIKVFSRECKCRRLERTWRLDKHPSINVRILAHNRDPWVPGSLSSAFTTRNWDGRR